MESLPDIDGLWNYEDPAGTERRLRDLLECARATSPDRTAPESAGFIAEILTQVARAQGLQGRFEDAHHSLNEAEALADRGTLRARIRVLLERGRLFNSSGKRAEACPLFLQAYETARDAGEANDAVDAAHMLGIAEHPERQLEWSLSALDLAEKSADPRTRKWLHVLYNNIGWTYHDLGKYEPALEMFQKALRSREQQGVVKPVRIAKWSVARTLRSLGRTEGALAIQRALLSEWEQDGQKDGYVYEEIAECLLALGRAEEARPYFAAVHAELSRNEWLVAHEPARLARFLALSTP
jgi:tetratricopeptide (TPR) repeat protein